MHLKILSALNTFQSTLGKSYKSTCEKVKVHFINVKVYCEHFKVHCEKFIRALWKSVKSVILAL